MACAALAAIERSDGVRHLSFLHFGSFASGTTPFEGSGNVSLKILTALPCTFMLAATETSYIDHAVMSPHVCPSRTDAVLL